jgi:uroporphyrinogen III methyltransferase/synthase
VTGAVALVGAGPGDPGLMTVRGLALLRRAEVLVHDRLVDPRLLDEAPRDALRIYAGKASGEHTLPQGEINALLVTHARAGRFVVRLKGGDPFVLGRGGEEAEALAAAGIPFEVVPGVTSAIAVPAAAGIPLTHRGVASSFAVVTGHEDACGAGRRVDWARLATAVDTLVILMGARSLPRIARDLLDAGRAGDTPVAIIRRGTTESQATLVGRLDEIATLADTARIEPPVVIVVGAVVALRARLGWPAPGSTATAWVDARGDVHQPPVDLPELLAGLDAMPVELLVDHLHAFDH